jgi:hypothetical protein
MSYATNWLKARPQTRSHAGSPPARVLFAAQPQDTLLIFLHRLADDTQLTVTLTADEVARLRDLLTRMAPK